MATPAQIEGVTFHHPARAALDLQALTARLTPGLRSAVLTLLAESPDPDAALNLFERLAESATAELLAVLDKNRFLVHYALALFANSHFLGETLIQNPDLFHHLLRDRNLDRSLAADDFRQNLARFRSRSMESDFARLLARFKKREYVRIVLRDVLGIATLAATTQEISALSDVLLEAALDAALAAMAARYGKPRRVDTQSRLADVGCALLSLGKLGGNELNYSSDVDLFFIFDDGDSSPAQSGDSLAADKNAKAHTPAATKQEDEDFRAAPSLSTHEYFVRVAQQTTELLSRVTPEGAVFRIDLRLRPQGNEGEPAVGLRSALHYYRETAHDWELQAMIKARYSAGDITLARKFIRGVQPNVYKQHLNFAAIKTALVSREKIQRHRSRLAPMSASTATPASADIDVKLDPGGIRDIEFLVQCLQRVYGGPEPWLRSSGTLFSLQKLHDKGHITGKDFHDLSSAYEFLRKTEHRLQLLRGQQLHKLPSSADDLQRLYRSILPDETVPSAEAEHAASHAPARFIAIVRERMAAVAEIYRRVIYAEQQEEVKPPTALPQPSSAPDPESWQSFHQVLARLARDSPRLHRLVSDPALDPHARRNLHRFLESALTSAGRYATVLRHADAVERAVPLFQYSDYVADLLTRYPEEIECVAQPCAGDDSPELPSATVSRAAASTALPHADVSLIQPTDRAPIGDAAEHDAAPAASLAGLRQRYRRRIVTAAAEDVLRLRPVEQSLHDTSRAADEAIVTAWHIAGAAFAPSDPGAANLAGKNNLAIFALGRLGTLEFDLASDADLLLIRDTGVDPDSAPHSAADSNASNCAAASAAHNSAPAASHAAAAIVEALASYTRDGTVFPVDNRLRPRGSEGELVITAAELHDYLRAAAQPWEALTYTKLRCICGPPAVQRDVEAAVQALMERFALDSGFAAAVRDMRARLERTDAVKHKGGFNMKTAAGAIYDIDFLISYFLVKHPDVPRKGTLLQRLHALQPVIGGDVPLLANAIRVLRTVDHISRLVTGRSRKTLPPTERALLATSQLAEKVLRHRFEPDLPGELARIFADVRVVYSRLLQ